jgi:hypothetical protein
MSAIDERPTMPTLVRSNIIPPGDNVQFEKKYMAKLKAGGGLLGLEMINMMELKKEKLHLTGQQENSRPVLT